MGSINLRRKLAGQDAVFPRISHEISVQKAVFACWKL